MLSLRDPGVAISCEEAITNIRKMYADMNDILNRGAFGPVITDTQVAGDMMNPILSPLRQEEVWVMSLNARSRMLRVDQVYRGTIDEVRARMAEVFRMPIIVQASSIIVFHNHPSGDPTPSDEDLRITRAIRKAGKVLEIDVLDHIIIADNQYQSIKELTVKKGE